LQILSECIARVGIKAAYIAAKLYNVNHTALVYYENGVYKVFQANRANNVHTLLLSDYMANTQADIYCSIHTDTTYTFQNKRARKKYINFYCSKIKYNIALAFLAWRPVRKLCSLFFKEKNLKKFTLCSDIVIRLFERVFKKDIRGFLDTKYVYIFKDNHSNTPWRIWYAVNRKKIHDDGNYLTNTIILGKQDIINTLL